MILGAKKYKNKQNKMPKNYSPGTIPTVYKGGQNIRPGAYFYSVFRCGKYTPRVLILEYL